MSLEDVLGIDPQNVLDDVIKQRAPDLAQGGLDPHAMMDRLIRRNIYGPKKQPQQPKPATPADLGSFGRDAPSPGDLGSFGRDPEEAGPAPPAEAPKPDSGWGIGEGASVVARSAGEGVMKGTGAALKAGSLGPEMAVAARNQITPDRLDQSANDQYGELAAPFGKEVKARRRQQEAAREREAEAVTQAGPVAQRPMARAGQVVQDVAKDWVTPEEKAKYPIGSQVGGMVGGAVPAVLGGVGAGMVGGPAAGIGVASGIMAAQSAGDTFDRAKPQIFESAKTAGMSDAEADRYSDQKAAEAAGLSGVIMGATGALPIGVILGPAKQMAPGLTGRLWAMLDHAVKSGTTFATVGEAQHYIGEQLAQSYDPSAHYEFDYKRLIASFLAGGMLGAAHTALQGRPQEVRSETASDTSRDTGADRRTGLPPPGEAGARTGTDTGPRPGLGGGGAGEAAAEKPQPFKSGLNPKVRAKVEEAANYYKEFDADEVASWSDAKLKEYVARKSAEASMGTDDDVLRRAGHSDEEVAGMSAEEKKKTAEEARGYGVHAGAEPAREGTREAPVEPKTAEDVARAADVADPDHTPAQGEANNAQRGHMRWNGLDITIEAKKGGMRRGTQPDGTPFETQVGAHYGYFKGLPKGADGMEPDVFVGDHPTAPSVFVIDEVDPKTGKFRQTKSFAAFQTWQEAVDGYLATSSKTGAHIGGMRSFPAGEFVDFARSGGLSKPVSEAMEAGEKTPPGGISSPTRDAAAPHIESDAGVAAGPEHHQAVADAVRSTGADPATLEKATLDRAADLHAQGAPPDHAFVTAVARDLIDGGFISVDTAKKVLGDAAAQELLEAGNRGGERVAPAQAPGAGPVRPAATAEEDRGQGGAEAGAAEAPGREREAAGAGHPEGRGRAADHPAGRERNAADRQEPAGRQPAAAAADGEASLIGVRVTRIPDHKVTAADNKTIQVAPVVVEAKDLITSADTGYDKSLQPRQRDRAASQAQIREIATRLDPERLGYSAEADRGAPIVGPDRMVESGNGRVEALRALYRTKGPNAKKYREWLKGQGVDVDAFKEPVLVRQRVTDLTPEERKAFTVAANQAATLAMSAPERAMADARHLTPGMLDRIEDAGNLGSAGNRGFVRAFVAAIPASERGALTDAGGALSAEGLTRARNAVLAKAYGDADVLSRITESTDDDIKSISNALVLAAPQWAAFRSAIEAGRVRADVDATDELMAAVKQTADIRARGDKLDEWLRQHDAFDQLPGMVETWMRLFYNASGKRAASASHISNGLRFYAQEAAKVSNDPKLDLGAPEVSAKDIQDAALAKAQGVPIEGAGDRGRPHGEADGRRRSGLREGGEETGRREPGPAAGFAESDDLFGPTERTAAGQQGVLPGAERISSAELAKRRAAQPLKPKVAQKPLEGGLFGDEGKQTDLVDQARKPTKVGGMRHNPFAPTAELVSAIRAAMDESNATYFGLRVEDGRKIAPGEVVPDSRVWDDGVPTDETADGTATIGLGDEASPEKIERALTALGIYLGDQLVLVGGKTYTAGVDDGEHVIRRGQAVAVWPPPSQTGIANKSGGPGKTGASAVSQALKPEAATPHIKEREAGHGAEGPGVRQGAPQVPAGGAAGRVRKAPARRQPDQLSLFGGEPGAEPLRDAAGATQQRPGGAEPPVSPEGGEVTKPPARSGRNRPRRGDKSAEAGLAQAQEKIAERSRLNYRITDEDKIGEGGPKQKVRGNLEAIRILKAIEDEARQPTPEEKAKLVKYVGWGAFAQDVFSPHKSEWKAERDALRALLDDDEFSAARASTLNAHFTSPDVIRGMWDALNHLGFKGGLAIEPSAGVGHFLGLIPDHMAPKTAWTAVELDPITGRIAKLLYGGAEVNVHGYQDLKRPSNYYDLAISNVPFGDYAISEKPYGAHSIHDFFFVKSLDKVRPGGVVAFITSRYTMDKVDDGVRHLLAKTADLVGAIRLPGGKKGAFAGNAGTEVTTDIIFLRKKVPGEPAFPGADWMGLKEIETPEGPVSINEYFANRPKTMLGDMRLTGTMYGKNEPVLVGETEGIRERIAAAAAGNMQEGAMLEGGQPPPPDTVHSTEIEGPVKDGAFFVKDGTLYQRRHGMGHLTSHFSPDDVDRIRRLVGMRDTVNELLAAQLGGDPTASAIQRKKLNAAYEAFVRKHGPINLETQTVTSRLNKAGEPVVITRLPNLSKFLPDPDAWKVAAIENYDAETGKAKPADILTRDVIAPPKERQINGPGDALAASLDETGGVDLDHIADSLNLDSREAAARAMGDLVFLNPDGRHWQTADDYLSGDVVKKLEDARAIATDHPEYQRNVAALEKVQPVPLTRADIVAQFGAPWVPEATYQDFFKEALGANMATVKRVPVTGEWRVSLPQGVSRDATSKFGTDHMSVDKIATAALNNTQPSVYDRDADGKAVLNQAATELARLKVNALKEAFTGDPESAIDGWVWGDNDRSTQLEAIYNRTFNNLVPQRFDGSHLTFAGLNPMFADRQHRKDAVWRMLQRGNTLLAHVVGSGKTVTMIAGGMEMKRLGLIRKPAYVVPNHMLEQFSREFIQAYPNAKILVASKEEASRENRKEFLAKVAANDWDGVIITHDAFGRINMAHEWRKRFILDQLNELDRLMRAEVAESGKSSPTVKGLEKAKKRLETKLTKLMSEDRKDEGTTFEESGIDHLFVDEAHKFKNLAFITRMQRVKGLSQGDSQRAEDLFLKIRYLEGKRPGRSAVFATGTPVSNTMAELWTMMRYLELNKLEERNLSAFDDWASTFGRVVNNMELSADGRTFKEVSSFSKFVNVPELISIYSEIADTKTADMLNLPRPEVRSANGTPGIEIVEAKPSGQEEAYINDLVKLAESLKGKRPEKGQPNMLSVVTRGRKVATDGRLVGIDDVNPSGKIAKAVDNIFEIWKDGKEPGTVQMVFLDLGVPQTRAAAKPKTVDPDSPDYEIGDDIEAFLDQKNAERATPRVDLYADLKGRLIAKGIPAKQIAAIHDATDDAKKAKLFARVRAGDVRVLIGSTEKMGVGTNVQDRLIAMHHLDAPWKPAEVEQRDGRIVRQGNKNPNVRILRYVTAKSFDAFMWQKLDTKAKFIGQVLSGAKGSRHAEDIDNPLPEAAEMKAAASGDPRILEHAELDRIVRQLAAQKRSFEQSKSAAGWQEKSAKSALELLYEKELPGAKADAGKAQDLSGDKFKVTLGDKELTDRAKAGEIILKGLLALDPATFYTPKAIDVGTMSGFRMQVSVQSKYHAGTGHYLEGEFSLRHGTGRGYGGFGSLNILKDTDPAGFIRRFENILKNIRQEPERIERAIATERDNLTRIEKTLKEIWPKEKEFRAAIAKLEALETALKAPAGEKGISTAAGSEETGVAFVGVGKPIIVLRVGGAGESLAGRNAGNTQGLVKFLADTDDKQMGVGDTINAYRVVFDQVPGEYSAQRQGTTATWASAPSAKVGRQATSADNGVARVWYSFPADGSGFKAERIASVLLESVRKQLEASGHSGGFDLDPHDVSRAALRDAITTQLRKPDESKIVNPIDPKASPEEKVRQLHALTEENKPLVEAFIKQIDAEFGTASKWNEKLPENIISKGSRPSILARKPWHRIEHVRDSFRFKTVLADFRDLPDIVERVKAAGFEIVKPDMSKVIDPLEFGWRIAALDLRFPNGQLVEYYFPFQELEDAKKNGGHDLFERWRNRRPQDLTEAEEAQRQVDAARSRKLYQGAWEAFLARSGISESEVRASLSKAMTAASSSTGLKSSKSPNVMSEGFQAPSTRMAANLSDRSNTKTTDESALSTYAPDVPATTLPSTENISITGSSGKGLTSGFAEGDRAPPFYSAVERAITGAKQDKAAPNHWLGTIRNTPGVKPEEIAWLGLEDWLRDHKGPVTKQEIADYVRANQIEVKEVEKRQGGPKPTIKQADAVLDWAERQGKDLLETAQDLIGDFEDGRHSGRTTAGELEGLGVPDDLLEPFRNYAGGEDGVKFGQWVLPGGENYRELLLTLPPKENRLAAAERRYAEILQASDHGMMNDAQVSEISALDAIIYDARRAGEQPSEGFRSSHWDEPNGVAHVRFNDREIGGKKTLFIEEFQSDWGQGLRRGAALREVSKPQSVGKLVEDFFGSEAAPMVSLPARDAAVLPMLEHNEVRKAVIGRIPVDVVNILESLNVAPDALLRDLSVLSRPRFNEVRGRILPGIVSAIRETGTDLRAKLLAASATGRDEVILPTLRASNLSAREVVGMLAPQTIYHVGTSDRAPGNRAASTGTELPPTIGGVAGVAPEGLPADGAQFLSAPLVTSRGAVAPVGAARAEAEGAPTSVASLLDWHNRISPPERRQEYRALTIPAMPFEKNWHELSLKRIVRYAAENGYEQIAWTPGSVQADRYDLSKQISEVKFTRSGSSGFTPLDDIKGYDSGTLVARDHSGATVIDRYVKAEELPDYVGKDVAEKLLAQEAKGGRSSGIATATQTLSGLDLKVGGEGMAGFYDKILPAAANKLGKKFGAKVGQQDMPVPELKGRRTGVPEQDALAAIEEAVGEAPKPSAARTETVHTLAITPELRKAAVSQGFPLFEGSPPAKHTTLPYRDLGPLKLQPKVPIGKQLQDYVVDYGRATNVEHLVAVDAKGKPFNRVFGVGRAVGLPPDMRAAILDPSQAVVIHHNHPSNSGLSTLDISQLAAPGLAAIWAHGHEGHVARAALTPAARTAFRRLPAEQAWKNLHNVTSAINMHFYRLLNEAASAEHELITLDQAFHAQPHLVSLTLARAGVIDYRSNTDVGTLIADLNLEPHIEHAARMAQGRLLNEPGTVANHGLGARAEPLRHPGDLGTLFGRPAGAPGQRRSSQRNDRGRGEVRKAEEAGQIRLPGFAEGLEEGAGRYTAGAGAGGAGGAGAPPPGGTAAGTATPPPPRPPASSGPRPITGRLTNTNIAKGFKQFWQSTFQPEMFSDRALEADPLFARYKAASAQEKDAVIHQSESHWEYWNKRGDAERIRFLDDVETAQFGNVPPDRTQADMARRYRAMLDANWREEKRYGSQAAFVEDYFPHIWEEPEKWRAFSETRSAQVGPTWFQKKRTIDYITDGLAAGLKLKYTNPVDIVVHRLMSGVDMRQRMELLYELKKMGLAWEGEQGGDQLAARGWRKINAPDRKQWVLAPDVQLLWKNAVEAKGLWQAEHVGGSMFRGWMALKNVWVPLKLALSAFHPLHVLHINWSNGMARAIDDITKGKDPVAAFHSMTEAIIGPMRAAPGASVGAVAGITLGTFTPIGPYWGALAGSIAGAAIHGAARRRGMPDLPHLGKTARKAWAKRPSQQTPAEKAMVALMTEGGFVPQLSEQLKIAAKRQFHEALQKVLRKEAGASDWRKFISGALRRPIEALQAPIFEQWIPNIKAAAFLNEAAALLRRRPELLDDHAQRRVALRALGQQTDSRFGEKFYGSMFWNRYLKDAAIGSFLSLGWNYGFVQQYGGAAMEAVTRPLGILPPFRPNKSRKTIRYATNKITGALVYFGTAALINGLMTLLYTGEQPKDLDFVFARIGGENPDGSPRRITNMFYLREYPMLQKHAQDAGNWFTGALDMIGNKLMFGPFIHLLHNRDYYGYNIWDENAPVYKQFWQAFKHTIGEETNPMSVSGAKRAAEFSGKPFPSVSEAIQDPGKLFTSLAAKGVGESMMGFGPAPAYVEKTALQNRIAHLYKIHVAPLSRTFEEGEMSKDKMSVRTAIMLARRNKDSPGLTAAYARGRALGLTQDYMNKVGRDPTDLYLFSRLPDADQKAILRDASPEEYKRYFPRAHQKVKFEFYRKAGGGAAIAASP